MVREGGIVVSTLMEPDKEKATAHKARAASYGAEPNAGQLREIVELIDGGRVKVTVTETFRFEDVRDAYARLEKGSLRGKLVLTLG